MPERHPGTDAPAALDFLRRWLPSGPWTIVHDQESSGGGRARWSARQFVPGQEDALLAHVEAHSGLDNLYFVVNLPTTPLQTSPQEEEIEALLAVTLDVDLPADAPDEQRTAVLDAIRAVVPPPTAVVWSGGGWQAHWLYDAPLSLGYSERVAAACQKLAAAFGGDAVQNINRLMRLPGTVNVLNEKKRRAGRTPAPALVVEADWTRRYTIDAPPPDPPAPPAAALLADLDKTWAQRVRSGDTAWLKGKDRTKSAAVFAVTCYLVRLGWAAESVVELLTDRSLGISSHIYEQGDPRRYAERQVARAEKVVAQDYRRDPKTGAVVANSTLNVRKGFANLGTQLQYDTFANRLEYVNGAVPAPQLLDDAAVLTYLAKFETELGFRPVKDFFYDTCVVLSRERRRCPPAEYLAEREPAWDGTERTETWLVDLAGAPDNPYVRAVSRMVLVAAVARVREPGCKFDEMVVFESPAQGTEKSSALEILAVRPEWFTDSLELGAKQQEVMEKVEGKWIVESSDLVGIHRSEVEHLKAFLSRRADRARPAYGRMLVERPRMFVIFGTTNNTMYLIDDENRRFLPIRIVQFDLPALAAVRDQLWAEAAHLHSRGFSIRLPRELWPYAAAEQAKRRVIDPWLESLDHAFGAMEGSVLSSDVWKIVGRPEGYRTQGDNRRVGAAMKELKWERVKTSVQGFGPGSHWVYRRGSHHSTIFVNRDPVTGEVSVDYTLPSQRDRDPDPDIYPFEPPRRGRTPGEDDDDDLPFFDDDRRN